MGKENSWVLKFEKNHTLEKNSKFRVIVYCPTPISDNSELGKCIFYGIALTLGFERNRTNLDYVFWVKALVDSEKSELLFLGIGHKIKTITWNSEFSLPSMSPRVMVKLWVIVFTYRWKTITRNSEFTWERIQSFPRISELSLWPLIF